MSSDLRKGLDIFFYPVKVSSLAYATAARGNKTHPASNVVASAPGNSEDYGGSHGARKIDSSV